jgi:hypothetical protein
MYKISCVREKRGQIWGDVNRAFQGITLMENFNSIRFFGSSYEDVDTVHFVATVELDGEETVLDTTTCFDEGGSQTPVVWGCVPNAVGAWALATALIREIGWESVADIFADDFARNFVSSFPAQWELTGAQVWRMLNECMNAECDDEYFIEYNPFEDCDEIEAAQTFQIGEVKLVA